MRARGEVSAVAGKMPYVHGGAEDAVMRDVDAHSLALGASRALRLWPCVASLDGAFRPGVFGRKHVEGVRLHQRAARGERVET